MVMCCQSNSNFLIFAVLVVRGRVAVKRTVKLKVVFTFISTSKLRSEHSGPTE